jgi:hypothetical protein
LHPSIAADLVSAFNDPTATVAVTIGAVSTRGYEDVADQIENDSFGNGGQVRVRIISIYTGSLGAGLVDDATIVVAGVNRKVRQIALADDGLMQHVVVAG